MAKKTTAKQNTNNGESKFKGIRNFFTSERTRFITGLVISIVTIYVGLAFRFSLREGRIRARSRISRCRTW